MLTAVSAEQTPNWHNKKGSKRMERLRQTKEGTKSTPPPQMPLLP